jgi:polyhydroxybutyrate depolymerase
LPLVVVLHGGGLNARNAMEMTDMAQKADRENFVAVFPNGTGRLQVTGLTWNAGGCCGYAKEQQVNDVHFIGLVIAELRSQLPVDQRRIYVTGASNGAMLAYRVGCELSETIAAIGPAAGYMASQPCQPARPLSLVIYHGTADEVVPYRGGVPLRSVEEHNGPVSSVADAVSFWTAHNKCVAATAPAVRQTGSIIRRSFGPCIDGVDVVLYTIEGGGHAWPGGRPGTARGDVPTTELSATDTMWAFFAAHPRL